MFSINNNNCTLSVDEISFHRNYPDSIDAYDYFNVDIKLESKLFNFNLKNKEIYIYHLNDLISGIKKLLSNERHYFILALYNDVFKLELKKSDNELSYDVYFTLKSSDGGEFSLNGEIDISNDDLVHLYNDIKYFMSAYE